MSEEKHLCGYVYISMELVAEILKCLPAKSLLRFMSVCKSWYSLIKSSDFISTHFNHQLSISNSIVGPTNLLYRNSPVLEKYCVYTDNDDFEKRFEMIYHEGMCSVGCCNGIVLFVDFIVPEVLALWNSSMGKSRDLRVPHCRASGDEQFVYWLGFDSSSDLKVVVVAYSTSDLWETRPCGVYLYSLNQDAWRVVNSSFVLYDGFTILDDGVYFNGVIHWVAQRYYEDRDMPDCILTFNLDDEIFRAIGFPEDIAYVPELFDMVAPNFYLYDSVSLMIVKRSGRECLAALHGNWAHFKLWVMEEEGMAKSWTEVFCVNRNVGYKKALNVTTKGQIIVELERGGVVSLDPESMKLKVVSVENMLYEGIYLESLILL